MKTQRRFFSVIAGLAAVATMASACGPNNAAISGKSPAQILAQALSKFSSQKFTFTASITLKLDASKVSGFSAAQLGAFGPIATSGLTIGADGTVESKSRVMVHVKLGQICTGDIWYTEYDGTSFMSTDGKTWYKSGTASTSNTAVDQNSTAKSLEGVGFKDKGSANQDGQDVEDIQLPLDNHILDQIAAASNSPQVSSTLKQLISIKGDSLDVYVRPADGLLESVKGTLNSTVDVTQVVTLLGALSPQVSQGLGSTPPSGTLGVSLSTNDQFTNYGNASVSQPNASTGTPTNPCANLSALGSMFGGLAGGSSSGDSSNQSVPTPDLSALNNNSSSDANVFSNISNGLDSN